MSYTGRFNKIIQILNDRGLDKTALDVSEAKDAMFGDVPMYGGGGGLRYPRMHGQREPARRGPSGPATPFSREGEFVIQLNPTNGKEELMMWDGKKLIPKRELENLVVKGVMREERLIPAYHNSDMDAKKQAAPILEMANKNKTFSNMSEGEIGIPYFPTEKLSYISECLEKRGYTLLVKKLKTAVEAYHKADSESK